ncbi:ABC transporter ATP-binding protein [Patescibacteria group bacterium]
MGGKSKRGRLTKFKDIYFTFAHITKLAYRIKPKLLIAVFVLNALWGLSAVPGFYLEKLLIDSLVDAVGTTDYAPYLISIGAIAGGIILLELFRSFLGTFMQYLRRAMSRYFDIELHMMIGDALSRLDLATIEDPKFRDKFDKIEKEASRRAWGMMMPLSDLPNYLFGFIAAILVITAISPFIAIFVLAISLPQVLVNSKFIKKDYELVSELTSKSRRWRWLESYLLRNKNYMEFKILDLSSYVLKKAKKLANEVVGKRIDLERKRTVARTAAYIPLSIFEFLLTLLLIFWVISGRISVGTIQLYIRSLRSAQRNLSGFISSILEIYENYVFVKDLVWLFNLKPDIEKDVSNSIKIGNIETIEFDGVYFKYRDDNPWILRGVDFKIESGEKIAIVGENGAGKSTLIKLIARFYDAQKGERLVSGIDMKRINLPQWRKRIAILFQMFESYPFSSYFSIGSGDVKRIGNKEEIVDAAKRADIHEFIQKLPGKYNNPLTPYFEKGVQPSIGQWQRLGIARMLFRKNADLIILDEPTSNVDPEAEEKIFKELRRITKNKMLIFVTQRFSTVKIADRIFVMHKGKIVEQGTHLELMKLKGRYAKLFTLQAEAYLK